MPVQCQETIAGVQCIRNKKHPGDCQPPDPVHYDILDARDWIRLESYKDDGDEHGYALELRDLCEDNPPLWGNMVLGNDPAPHFLEIREEVDQYDKVLIRASRGFSKSTSYTLTDLSHHIPYSTLDSSFWFQWTGLLVRESATAAEKTMATIKELLTDSPLVKMMFPAFRDIDTNTKRWNDEKIRFDIDGHTTDMPTLQGMGPRGSMTGDHPDAGYFDDVATEDNSETQHKRDRMWSWWSNSMEGVLDEAVERHAHTPYRPDDLNGRLLDQGTYHVVEIPALNKMPNFNDHVGEDGVIHGPDGETVVDVEPTDKAYEELESNWPCPRGPRKCEAHGTKRDRQRAYRTYGYHQGLKRLLFHYVKNPHSFERQRMLKLTPGEGTLVDEENIRCFVWEGDPRVEKKCPYNSSEVIEFPGWGNMIASVHGWDHAIGQEAKHDETAHAIVYRSQQNRVFVPTVDSDNWKSTRITGMMERRFHANHRETGLRPLWIVTEGVNFQRAFGEWLEEKGEAMLPIDVFTNPSNKALEFVESGLQAAIVQGRVFFHLDDRKTMQQFTRFTGEEGRDDDRVDAVRIAYTKLREVLKRYWRAHRTKGSGSRRKRASKSRNSKRSVFHGSRRRRRRR